eukprot:6209389-Pleurochrysis_carterae.AAC.1
MLCFVQARAWADVCKQDNEVSTRALPLWAWTAQAAACKGASARLSARMHGMHAKNACGWEPTLGFAHFGLHTHALARDAVNCMQ